MRLVLFPLAAALMLNACDRPTAEPDAAPLTQAEEATGVSVEAAAEAADRTAAEAAAAETPATAARDPGDAPAIGATTP